jgi:hypothetical protein
VASGSSNNVTVVIKPAGDSPPQVQTYSVGAFPLSVAAGDINGDGRVDIVTANNSGNSISVLLNDGSGFSPGTAISVSGGPRSVVLGDFNGDSRLDLVVGTSGNVAVRLGNGQGSFGAPINVGGAASFMITADFNNDGRLDLAVSDSSTQILLGTGTGNFTFGCGATGGGVAAGDLNGDGQLDLVTADVLQAKIHVMLRNGAGCFGASFDIDVLNVGRPRYVALADLNGDHKLDIIGGTAVMLGDGTGAFSTPTYFGSGSVGPEPGSNTVVGDFDGDTYFDIATAGSGSVGILLGNGGGGFKFASGTFNRGATSLARGDINADGKMDIVAASDGGVAVMLGDGMGGFAARSLFSAPTFITAVVLADFNRDGKLDIGSVGPNQSRFHVMLGNGFGGFDPPISTNFTESQPGGLSAADVNGDGNVDLITQVSGGTNLEGAIAVALGDGTGHFGTASIFSARRPSNPTKVAIADFNQDGNADLAVPGGFGFSILLGNGAGGFAPRTHITTANSSSIATGDVNGDGRADLAMVSEEPNGKLSVVLGDGAGGFSQPFQASAGSFSRDVVLTDFNGDGKLDVAAANGLQDLTANATSTVSVLFGDGAGTFGPVSHFVSDRESYALVSGDFNGDGRPDLVASNYPVNNLSMYLNRCTGPAGVATIKLASASYNLNEGGTSLIVTVNRTGNTSLAATVTYATSDSAGSAACSAVSGNASDKCDYTPASGTLSFAAEETSKTFVVPVVDDGWLEGNETFQVSLTSSTGANLTTPATATVTIIDNDAGVGAPNIFLEAGTDRIAALDSVTFVKGPFRVIDPYNFALDQHTRLIILTSNLKMTQADPGNLLVQASGVTLPVESVGSITNIPGLDASYIVVKLPDGLPTGDLQLVVTLRGMASNLSTLQVVP